MTIASRIIDKVFVLHLIRGLFGALCLGFAFLALPEHLAVGMIFAILALAAFRGCPTCWLAGLFSICSKGCVLPPPDKPVSH